MNTPDLTYSKCHLDIIITKLNKMNLEISCFEGKSAGSAGSGYSFGDGVE